MLKKEYKNPLKRIPTFFLYVKLSGFIRKDLFF